MQYGQYRGWLHSIPDTGDKNPKARIELVEEEEVEVIADHIKEIFDEIIWSNKRVSFIDIKTYRDLMGIDLNPWEVETLARMFSAYYGMLVTGRDVNCVSPLLEGTERQAAISKLLIAGFER